MKILTFILSLFITFNVHALELNTKAIDNIFYTIRSDKYVSYQFEEYSIDNKVVYCIEPYLRITTKEYLESMGLIDSPYDNNINNKIKLISYYGYGYNNHNTIYHRIATQALIWEIITGGIVEFYTKQFGYGDYINIDKEKNDILYLVNNHDIKPTFINKTYNLNIKDELILYDANITKYTYSIGDVLDNNLILNFDDIGNYKIDLKYKKYNDYNTSIFIGIDNKSQKLGYFNLDDDIYSFNVNVISNKIKVNNIDKDNNKINGFKFELYDINNKLIGEYETKDGTFTSDYLSNGTYILKQVDSMVYGYIWNSEEIQFTIDNNDTNYIKEIDFINDKVMGNINLYIKGEDIDFNTPNWYYSKDIDAIFNLYDTNYNLIKVLDFNGNIKVDIELGTYIIKQVESSFNNIIDDNEYIINIEYKDQYTSVIEEELHIKNYIDKFILEFNKYDYYTNNRLKDTLIGVYNNDILINTYKTDLFGQVIIELPDIGNYYIKELEPTNGYLLNDEILYFDKDNSIINMSNKKITIDVPNTYSYSYNFLYLIGGIFILYGKKYI